MTLRGKLRELKNKTRTCKANGIFDCAGFDEGEAETENADSKDGYAPIIEISRERDGDAQSTRTLILGADEMWYRAVSAQRVRFQRVRPVGIGLDAPGIRMRPYLDMRGNLAYGAPSPAYGNAAESGYELARDFLLRPEIHPARRDPDVVLRHARLAGGFSAYSREGAFLALVLRAWSLTAHADCASGLRIEEDPLSKTCLGYGVRAEEGEENGEQVLYAHVPLVACFERETSLLEYEWQEAFCKLAETLEEREIMISSRTEGAGRGITAECVLQRNLRKWKRPSLASDIFGYEDTDGTHYLVGAVEYIVCAPGAA